LMKTAVLRRSSRRPNLPLLLLQRRPWRGVGVLSVLSSGAALLGSGALGSSRQRRGSRPLVRGHRRGGAPLPFSFPLLLFFLCFSSLCFSDLATAQRGKTPRCGCAGGGGGLGGEAEWPSYGAAEDTAHGQFFPVAIHGVQAMVAMWSASIGPSLGFEGAVQGLSSQIPPWRSIRGGLGVLTLGLACVPAQHRPSPRARAYARVPVLASTAEGGRKGNRDRLTGGPSSSVKEREGRIEVSWAGWWAVRREGRGAAR
jgi:hypothetical protein